MKRLTFGACFSLFFLLNIATVKAQSTHTDTLKIMTFNIMYGGAVIDFDNVIKAINISGADIAGVQEAEGNIKRIATALKWPYYSARLHIVSKLPLINGAEESWVYTLVEIKPGRVIAVANTHLPSDPYGPECIRDGWPADSVYALERNLRLSKIKPFSAPLLALKAKGIPTFLTGDFNSPSYRDWTPATKDIRFQLKYPMKWPVSVFIENTIGLTDSYRTFFPDPIAKPGLTWTPGVVGTPDKPNETHDRIDFIWYAGNVKVLNSEILGEKISTDVSMMVTPYPTDHRAVISTFLIHDAPAPDFITAASFKNAKAAVVPVSYYSTHQKPVKIILRKTDTTNITRTYPVDHATGKITISEVLPTGTYALTLSGANSITIATSTFVITDSLATPVVTLKKTIFNGNEPITVSFKNAPGNRFDWIAIYPKVTNLKDEYGRPSTENKYLKYSYTRAKTTGTITLNKRSEGDVWPLPAGDYEIHLLKDDGFESLAETPFTISSNHK